MKKELTTEQKITRRTLISFSVFILAAILFVLGWKWLNNAPKEQPGATAGLRSPVRKVLDGNETLFRKVFSDKNLVKTYPKSAAARNVRVNGNVGLKQPVDTINWRLKVLKNNGDTLRITMADIRKLPKTELIFDFKCIEGWSQVTHWGGVKLIDFVSYYHLEKEAAMEYISLVTPDQQYYVGIDMASALHPQTLLCYEMNDKELPLNQGYPLRLIIPVKYGIKSLKRIGTLSFSKERPKDYWAERGYDYYSGL